MSFDRKESTWGTQHLDALKAGTAVLQPVVQTMRLGMIVDWGPGWVRKVWKPAPDLLTADGAMFGGYLAAMADQVLIFAAMTVVPNDRTFRTSNLTVNFYHLIRNEEVFIDARVLAATRQVINVEADFRNSAEKLVAKASAQQVLVPRPE